MTSRVAAVVALLLCAGIHAGEWTGSLKNESWLADPPGLSVPADRLGASETRLRLQYRGAWTGRWSLLGAAETAVVLQHHLLFGTAVFQDTASDPYRISDPDRSPIPSRPDAHSNAGLRFNLDRLALSWGGDKVDVTIGRQAVAWGSARSVNPTDVLAPFTVAALDTEYRPGVDAVRVRTALGDRTELDGGYVFGPGGDMSRSALFLRGRRPAGAIDLAVTLMRFREHDLVGVDMTRSFGGTGAWIEAAWVNTGAHGGPVGTDYLRWTAGVDRQLTPSTYAFVEIHFNGAGTHDRNAYTRKPVEAAYRDGAVYLLGCWYLSGGVTLQWTALSTGSVMVLANLDDGSIFASGRLSHSLSDNLVVDAGVYLHTGTAPPDTQTGNFAPAPFDEFGAWPGMVYVSLRYYF